MVKDCMLNAELLWALKTLVYPTNLKVVLELTNFYQNISYCEKVLLWRDKMFVPYLFWGFSIFPQGTEQKATISRHKVCNIL